VPKRLVMLAASGCMLAGEADVRRRSGG
jgi:hypothetical protein